MEEEEEEEETRSALDAHGAVTQDKRARPAAQAHGCNTPGDPSGALGTVQGCRRDFYATWAENAGVRRTCGGLALGAGLPALLSHKEKQKQVSERAVTAGHGRLGSQSGGHSRSGACRAHPVRVAARLSSVTHTDAQQHTGVPRSAPPPGSAIRLKWRRQARF